jgi:hypothetical protein
LTILELTKDGDSRGTAKSGFAGISIKSQYRSGNYLLVVHVRGENFTSDDLGLSVRALSATDPDTGKALAGAGACAVGGDLCAPGLRMKLPPSAPKQLELIFTVPNGLKQIAFELLTIEKWEK